MTNEDELYGIDGASRAMGRGSGPPRLRLKAGERARFHMLSTGKDRMMMGSEFHVLAPFPNYREAVCVRAMTGGAETCQLCEQGHTEKRNKFALWVYVWNVLRINDNPDEKGDSWPTAQIEDGAGRKRTLFREEVKRPLLLELSAGREHVIYRQFVNEYTARGSLQTQLYELVRIGEQLDTTYLLRAAKEMAIPEEVLGDERLKTLTPIPDLFRNSSSHPAGVSGGDVLGGEGADEIDTGDAAEEEFPKTALPTDDDDLI